MLFQILVLYDSLDVICIDKVVEFVSGLQQEDGSFFGDKWGEVDTRFSFCAVACLALLVCFKTGLYNPIVFIIDVLVFFIYVIVINVFIFCFALLVHFIKELYNPIVFILNILLFLLFIYIVINVFFVLLVC